MKTFVIQFTNGDTKYYRGYSLFHVLDRIANTMPQTIGIVSIK